MRDPVLVVWQRLFNRHLDVPWEHTNLIDLQTVLNLKVGRTSYVLEIQKKKLCLTPPKICPPDASSGSDHDLDHQIILKKWHFVIKLVISWSTSKTSKLSTYLRTHRAVRTNDNSAENPKNTPSLVLLKNKKKEQETWTQIGMFRPIRMDHTNCLQVAIKSIQFKLKKHKTDFKNGLSPVAVKQSVNATPPPTSTTFSRSQSMMCEARHQCNKWRITSLPCDTSFFSHRRP